MQTAGDCKNCGTTLTGAYCSVCGQQADVRILSLTRLVADALGDLFNFDSRIWRSLLTLLCKPGRLTSRYLEGKRTRYTPPFRMYVVMSVVFFLAFSLLRPEIEAPVERATAESVDAAVEAKLDAVFAEAGLTRGPDEAVEPDAPQRDVTREPGIFNIDRDDDGNWNCGIDKKVNEQFRARLETACRKLAADSGESFVRAFADNFPVMMLLFIPVVAAIMKVFYLFARRKYVEHLLFFLHAHTVFFFTALLAIAFDFTARRVPVLEGPASFVSFALWVYFPVYFFLAMRHVYRQGYALTAVKYVALGVSYLVALVFMLLGMIVYTALTL